MTGPRPTATTVHPEWSVAGTVEWSRRLVDPALRAAVGRLPESVRHIAGYHLGWWDRDGNPEHRGGKALRPAFTLLTAEAVGGAAARAAVPAAEAVELVQDFSRAEAERLLGESLHQLRLAEPCARASELNALACFITGRDR
ncbi:hypothetical protein [Saccharomonospora iraqiensis]|uniref:hypothetical protein n=1 Tax=Saccharomonospora iraqiensis TaxID=52698 RepID=UPI00022E60EB